VASIRALFATPERLVRRRRYATATLTAPAQHLLRGFVVFAGARREQYENAIALGALSGGGVGRGTCVTRRSIDRHSERNVWRLCLGAPDGATPFWGSVVVRLV
jgi:hypothetical protein